MPCAVLVSLSPFFAFGPLFRNRVSAGSEMRAVAICCMAWGTSDAVFITGAFLASNTSLRAAFDMYWEEPLLEVRVFTTVTAVIALLALLFRSQRVVAQDRAPLAGEMQAARKIQGLLVNSTLQVARGLSMEAVFRPAGLFGGDFYRCRLLPDGTLRVLLGDVSRKGAAEGHDNDSPSTLLGHLNHVFKHSGLGGFATCLCFKTVRPLSSCIDLFVKGNLAPGVSAAGVFDGIDVDWEFPTATAPFFKVAADCFGFFAVVQLIGENRVRKKNGMRRLATKKMSARPGSPTETRVDIDYL